MQSQVKISVIMSVYNSEKWLKKSILSILNQTYSDFEFIIVNDGSTDGSLSIIKSLQKSDKRIKLINQHNTGLTKSLNRAISISKGNLIARIDADDISLPTRLMSQYKLMNCNDKIGLCYTNYTEIDEMGEKIRDLNLPFSFNKIKKNLSNGINVIPHSSVMYRKSIFIKLGGYRERFIKSQDIDLWLRMMTITKFSLIKGGSKVLIRRHNQSITYKEFDLYSYISVLSFMIRKNSLIDPVSLSEKEYKVFFNWIISFLDSTNELLKKSKIDQIKQLINIKDIKIFNWFKILFLVFLSKHTYIILYEKLFGKLLFRRLFKEWKLKFNN
jgi:glycosyltransferase involved in cell wall biosynthesis